MAGLLLVKLQVFIVNNSDGFYDMHLENLVRRLEHDSMLAIEWFDSNNMKLIQDNCHFLWWANIGQTKTWESRKQKVLGITIKGNLRFDEYVLNQCKKAARKLSVVTKICQLMSLERRRTLMKSFIELQFGYCLLVWMFCGRRSNNHINHGICVSRTPAVALVPGSNLYLTAPAPNLYFTSPVLALNLCLLVLRFTVKVCYSDSVYLYKLSVYLYVRTC